MKIPIYKPIINDKTKQYVNDCLDSTWISSKGKYVELFENEFKECIGLSYATSVCNGTVALHLALLSLGIKEGDEVICPLFTCTATNIPFLYILPLLLESSLATPDNS